MHKLELVKFLGMLKVGCYIINHIGHINGTLFRSTWQLCLSLDVVVAGYPEVTELVV